MILISVVKETACRKTKKHRLSPEIQKLFLSNRRWEPGPSTLEAPRRIALSLRQGEGNHTVWCFPLQTQHFPLLFLLIVCVTISKRAASRVKISAGCNSRQRRKFEDSGKAELFIRFSVFVFLCFTRSWLPSQLQTSRWTGVPVYTPTCPVMRGVSSCQSWRFTLCLEQQIKAFNSSFRLYIQRRAGNWQLFECHHWTLLGYVISYLCCVSLCPHV